LRRGQKCSRCRLRSGKQHRNLGETFPRCRRPRHRRFRGDDRSGAQGPSGPGISTLRRGTGTRWPARPLRRRLFQRLPPVDSGSRDAAAQAARAAAPRRHPGLPDSHAVRRAHPSDHKRTDPARALARRPGTAPALPSPEPQRIRGTADDVCRGLRHLGNDLLPSAGFPRGHHRVVSRHGLATVSGRPVRTGTGDLFRGGLPGGRPALSAACHGAGVVSVPPILRRCHGGTGREVILRSDRPASAGTRATRSRRPRR